MDGVGAAEPELFASVPARAARSSANAENVDATPEPGQRGSPFGIEEDR